MKKNKKRNENFKFLIKKKRKKKKTRNGLKRAPRHFLWELIFSLTNFVDSTLGKKKKKNENGIFYTKTSDQVAKILHKGRAHKILPTNPNHDPMHLPLLP